MIPAARVLELAAYAANRYVAVAIVWHVAILAALLALLTHVLRPSARVAALALSVPLLSVAIMSAVIGNPFNAVVFGAATVLLASLARRADGPIAAPSPPVFALGAAATIYGLVYPHFIEPMTVLDYFYAAPTGILPCPTLAVVIGLALLGNGLDRAWSIALASLGLLYGVLGVAWLRVTLDVGLIAAAVGLLAHSIPVSRSSSAKTTKSTSAKASSASATTSAGSRG